jgi:hypothetical protein
VNFVRPLANHRIISGHGGRLQIAPAVIIGSAFSVENNGNIWYDIGNCKLMPIFFYSCPLSEYTLGILGGLFHAGFG